MPEPDDVPFIALHLTREERDILERCLEYASQGMDPPIYFRTNLTNKEKKMIQDILFGLKAG